MKNLKSILTIVTSALFSFVMFTAYAQSNMKYGDIENTQDRIEDLYVKVYTIVDKYPDITHKYVYDNGVVKNVIIDGVTNKEDEKILTTYLLDLQNLKSDISNQSNRFGVYYTTETEPKPEMGYNDFYDELHSNLTYPESATDRNVEGTVFVKFIVDSDGEISFIKATEDIDAPNDFIVKDLKKEAIQAVEATSGDWNPARLGGVPVAEWVVLPVQFKLESPYYRPFL